MLTLGGPERAGVWRLGPHSQDRLAGKQERPESRAESAQCSGLFLLIMLIEKAHAREV